MALPSGFTSTIAKIDTFDGEIEEGSSTDVGHASFGR